MVVNLTCTPSQSAAFLNLEMSEEMAVEGTMSSEVVPAAEGSRSIMDGALYLVEDRLQTFKDATWPFKSGTCSSLKVNISFAVLVVVF